MSTDTGAKLLGAAVGLFAPDLNATAVAVTKNAMVRRKIIVPLGTDVGTAGNAVGESPFFQADVACKVISVNYCTGVAVTADNSNYATLLCQKRPASAPGTPATVATNTTQITDTVCGANLVAFTPVSLTLTQANLAMAVGDVLTWKITKTGTGVAVGAAATASGATPNVTIVIEET